jgi:hypothetical protein
MLCPTNFGSFVPRGDIRRAVKARVVCTIASCVLPSPRDEKMSSWTKFALSVAIVLGTIATASAATKKHKIAVHRGGPRAQAVVPRTAPPVNPYSPAATGGGTPGYNQMLERY